MRRSETGFIRRHNVAVISESFQPLLPDILMIHKLWERV